MSSAGRRAFVAAAALAAIAGLVIVTRPGPSRALLPDASRPRPEPTHAHDTAPRASLAPAGATGAGAPASGSGAPSDIDVPRSDGGPATGAPAADGGGADSGTADAGGDLRSWIDHGRSAVVRIGQPLDRSLPVTERPLREPDWNAPTTLRFVDLKEHYRAFRKAGDFSAEAVGALNGAAAIVAGAVMPVDPIVDSGEMRRLWLSNPMIVMAGCVFCSPPTMGDLVLVTASRDRFVVDPERLFRGVVVVKLLGRLRLGPGRTDDGIEYLFAMDLERELD